MIVYKNTVNLQEAAVAALQPGDYYTTDANGNTIKLTQYTDGTFGFLGKGQKVPTKVEPNQVKQVPQAANASQASNATTGQVLKLFKDGDLKSRLQLRKKPFTKIYLAGGNIVVESLNHKTQTLCESLDIDIPDYLLKMKEEKYTAPLGATDLNFLLSDEIQKALQGAGKEIYTIDCSSGQPRFLDGNNQPVDINKITADAKAAAQQAEADAASQAVSIDQKMSKSDMKQITSAVLNTLQGTLKNFKSENGNTYNVSWEINNNAYDPKTISDGAAQNGGNLSEGLSDLARKVGQGVGNLIGTQKAAQRKMTNASVAAPFGVKATIVNAKTGDEEKDEGVVKELYSKVQNVISRKMGNRTNITSADANGKQYQTQCMVQIQPNVKDGTFMFKTQKNVGTVQDAAIVADKQDATDRKTQRLQKRMDKAQTQQANRVANYGQQVAKKGNAHNKYKNTVAFKPNTRTVSFT